MGTFDGPDSIDWQMVTSTIGRTSPTRPVVDSGNSRRSIMDTIQTGSPSTFNARGRAIPLPPDEEHRRALGAIEALERLDEMGDEAEQRATLEALMKAIDEDRLSDRKQFP